MMSSSAKHKATILKATILKTKILKTKVFVRISVSFTSLTCDFIEFIVQVINGELLLTKNVVLQCVLLDQMLLISDPVTMNVIFDSNEQCDPLDVLLYSVIYI